MSNTITAYFKGRVGVTESVYQNDYGILMNFDSIELPAHFDCYFSTPGDDEAVPAVGADRMVQIPNTILTRSGRVELHIPLHTGENDSEVEYIVHFKVIGRARPVDDGTPVQMTAIEQALALLQNPIGNIEQIVNEALAFTGDTFAEMQDKLDADQAAFEAAAQSRFDADQAAFKTEMRQRQTQVESDFDNLNAQYQTAVSALTVDSEVQNIRVGADNLTYTSAGESVRTQFNNLKSGINALSHTVFKQGETLSAETEANSWKLESSGSCSADELYKMVKYRVTAGKLLYLSLSKDSGAVYQFQDSSSVPSGVNTHLIGLPTVVATDEVVCVPAGATYLIVSQYKTNTGNVVAFAESDLNEFDLINEYGADTRLLNLSPFTRSSVTMVKNSDGSYSCSGTASNDVNITIFRFTQTIGETYHYKLNPNYDNETSAFYFYLSGINGDGSWRRVNELSWTATDESTVSITAFCPTGQTMNCTVRPIINSNYSNAELYEHVADNTAKIESLDDLAVSGKVIFFDNDDVTWQAPGTVMNYFSGEVTTGNPNVFAVTNNFDISELQNLVVHFAGYTYGNNGIVFFDINNEYISGIQPTTESDYSYDCLVQIPPNAKYCAVGRYSKDALSVYMLASDFVKQINAAIDLQNTVFNGGVRKPFNEYNAYPMMPSNYLTYAENAYASLISIMKLVGYNAIPAFIITDSHGMVMSPFAWLNNKDKSIKCLQLGDIVNDVYNEYEIDQYNLWAKKIDNICTVVGNHEVNYSSDTMSNYTLTKAYVTTDRHLGGCLNYYYVDDDDYRVRYICLDPFVVEDGGASSSCVFDATQIQWFVDTLTDSHYDCIILTHCPLCDSATDRSGNVIANSGPFPWNMGMVQTIIQSYQNKEAFNLTVDGISVTGSFANVKRKILCALCGHTHAEGTAFESGVRHYVADAYLNGRAFASTFIAIDRDSDLLRVIKFDNTQNLAEWDLSLNS